MREVRSRWILAFILATLAGAGLHFLYALLPNPLVGLIAPVNESVWEHLKLSFWPFLAAAAALCHGAEDAQKAWSGFLLGLLAIPAALLSAYYVLLCGFGVSGLAVDIGLYVLTMALGFWVAARRQNAQWTGILIILTAFYCVCLLLFSLQAPPLPIFQTP